MDLFQLVADLDDAKTSTWIEPQIVPLEYADATRLAQTLRRVLVQGLESTPEADALRPGRRPGGTWCVDFSPVLQLGMLPLNGVIQRLLALAERLGAVTGF